jgi:transposase
MSSSNEHLVAMEQWSGPERAVAVSAYYQNGDSVIAAQRVFRRHYEIPPHGQVPSAHAIRTWVRNFEETGSALKKSLVYQTRPTNLAQLKKTSPTFRRTHCAAL